MKTITLQNLRNQKDFFEQIASQLTLPEHCGHKLDALWDVLTTDIEGPIDFIWLATPIDADALGSSFAAICVFFQALVAERDDISFTLSLRPTIRAAN